MKKPSKPDAVNPTIATSSPMSTVPPNKITVQE